MCLFKYLWVGLLLLLSLPAWASSHNNISPLQTGDWDASQPAILLDGSIIFTTNQQNNLDLALWKIDGSIELWDDYPSDDYAPTLSPNGSVLAFVSTRAHAQGSVWIAKVGNHQMYALKVSGVLRAPFFLDNQSLAVDVKENGRWVRRSFSLKGKRLQDGSFQDIATARRFQTQFPFDTNHDGQVNHRDLAWIVDVTQNKPITPLSLNARDPVLDRQSGALWFSYQQGDARKLASIGKPNQDVAIDLNMASSEEWALLKGFRGKAEAILLNEYLWAAGYDQAVADRIQHMPVAYQKDVRDEWQSWRLQIKRGYQALSLQELKLFLQRVRQSPYSDYVGQVQMNVAMLLRQQSQGLEALSWLEAIASPTLSVAIQRAEILHASAQDEQAIQVLADAWVLHQGGEEQQRLLQALKNMDGSMLLYGQDVWLKQLLQSKKWPSAFESMWCLKLAALYDKSGDVNAAIELLQTHHAAPVLQTAFEVRLIDLLLSRGEMMVANAYHVAAYKDAKAVLRLNVLDVRAARLLLSSADRRGMVDQASAWWLTQSQTQQGVSQQKTAENLYIQGLIFTYKDQYQQASETLQQALRLEPSLWQARQTWAWVLEKSDRLEDQRQALVLYRQAYNHVNMSRTNVGRMNMQYQSRDKQYLRQNIVNLSFQLLQYDWLLDVLDDWWLESPKNIPHRLLMQAARAAFYMERPKIGLLWLDRLPDLLARAASQREKRIRGMLLGQMGQHDQAIRVYSGLLTEANLKIDQRRRLLLNRALQQLQAGYFSDAEDDLKQVLTDHSIIRDTVGLLNLGDVEFDYDARWIASSMLADSARMQASWLDEVKYLQIKLNKLDRLEDPAEITAMTHYQLGLALLSQMAWSKARQHVWISEQMAASLKQQDMLKQARWLRLRLDMNLGQTIAPADMLWLEKVAVAEKLPQRRLQMRLFVWLAGLQDERHQRYLFEIEKSVRLMSEKQRLWRVLVKDISADAPELLPLAYFHHARWLRHLGLEDLAQAAADQVLQQGDAWLAWQLSTSRDAQYNKDSERRLSRLIQGLDKVLPIHQQMIGRYYQHLAWQALQDENQRQALQVLFAREQKVALLRQKAVASRPLPRATSLKKMRRQMKSHEAIVFWWQHEQSSQGGELWWLDHDQLFHRHLNAKESQTWQQSVLPWKGDKKLLYFVQLHSHVGDAAVLEGVTGLRVVSSPTMLHAAYIGEQFLAADRGESDVDWLQRQWELAETSLMDWRLSLKRGIAAYKKQQWKPAMRYFKQVLALNVPIRHKEKVLELLGFSAVNAGLPEDVEGLFVGTIKSQRVRLLRYRVKAEALEKRGELFVAAKVWQRFQQNGKKWSDHVLAAKALARLALKGVVLVGDARQAVTDAMDLVPKKAVDVQVGLLLDQVTMAVQLQGGKANMKQLAAWMKQVRVLAKQYSMPAYSHDLKLLEITLAWKQGAYNGLLDRVVALRQGLAVGDLKFFDVDNLEALILQSMGRLGEARDRLHQAKNRLAEVDIARIDERLAGVHNNLGRLELVAGDLKQARAHFEYALFLDRRNNNKFGMIFDQKNLASLALKESNQDQARERIAEALRLSVELKAETQQVGLLLMKIAADLMPEDEVKPTLVFVRKVLDGVSLPELEWQYDWLHGRYLLQQEQQDAGEKELLLAIEKIESMKGGDVSDDLVTSRARVFDLLIQTWMQNKPLQALQISERLRRLTLHRLIGFDTPVLAWDGKLPKQNEPSKVIYHVGSNQSWVWVLSHAGVHGVSLAVSKSALKASISDVIQGVYRSVPVKKDVLMLTQRIWMPIRSFLPSKGVVDLILPAPLNQIPFAMLRADDRWLLEDYQFRYMQLLTPVEKVSDQPINGLAVSQEVFEGLPSLLLAKEEVISIGDFLPKAMSVSHDVSESDVLQAGRTRDWLHIASHAILDEQSPRFSRIQLSAGAGSDGRLHAYEVLKYKWKPETVVLSACHTGKNQQFSGYGTGSLSQAFLHAGVKRVISTLWQVNDTTSALLMKWFYRGLSTKTSVNDALHAAQVEMMQRFPHPSHWAQFRLELR